jgi:two-component system phosphate regulon sensor histidine kinase PhoR
MNDMDNRQDNMRFLSIIEDEANRLYRLINDILALSELEQKKAAAKKDRINIENSIVEVLSILNRQGEEKNIMLSMDVQEGLKSIKGDSDRLKQMLINLVDNAIKYTPQNGKVKVEAYNQADEAGRDSVVIKVIDNGIGIPEQHISRLFERFYRVDKARSRKVGGTGLGLAIVKHIVILFNGSIEVSSVVGKGTEFKIILPV